jgi:hypothetical protein
MWPPAVHAQQTAMPVVGFLNPTSAYGYAERLRAFRRDKNATNTMPIDRLDIAVTFDPRHGYVATAPGLPPVKALSLGGLRRRIEAALAPDDVNVRLVLDGAARRERDRRRGDGVLIRDPL